MKNLLFAILLVVCFCGCDNITDSNRQAGGNGQTGGMMQVAGTKANHQNTQQEYKFHVWAYAFGRDFYAEGDYVIYAGDSMTVYNAIDTSVIRQFHLINSFVIK